LLVLGRVATQRNKELTQGYLDAVDGENCFPSPPHKEDRTGFSSREAMDNSDSKELEALALGNVDGERRHSLFR